MIHKKAVMDAVAAAIHRKWPERDVHQNLCPVDFDRPCFLLETPRISRRDACAALIEETIFMTVTCFGSLDRFRRSDGDETAVIQQEVIDLFRCGYLSVADRAIKFSSDGGGIDFDRAWVDLQCSYFEQRGFATALPPMRQIHSDIKQEG